MYPGGVTKTVNVEQKGVDRRDYIDLVSINSGIPYQVAVTSTFDETYVSVDDTTNFTKLNGSTKTFEFYKMLILSGAGEASETNTLTLSGDWTFGIDIFNHTKALVLEYRQVYIKSLRANENDINATTIYSYLQRAFSTLNSIHSSVASGKPFIISIDIPEIRLGSSQAENLSKLATSDGFTIRFKR